MQALSSSLKLSGAVEVALLTFRKTGNLRAVERYARGQSVSFLIVRFGLTQ